MQDYNPPNPFIIGTSQGEEKSLTQAEITLFEKINELERHLNKDAAKDSGQITAALARRLFYLKYKRPYSAGLKGLLEMNLQADLKAERIPSALASEIRNMDRLPGAGEWANILANLDLTNPSHVDKCKEAYVEFARGRVSESALAYIAEHFDRGKDYYILMARLVEKVESLDLLSQLARGKLTYRSPTFTPDELSEFFTFLEVSLRTSDPSHFNSETTHQALSSLRQRVVDHEAQLESAISGTHAERLRVQAARSAKMDEERKRLAAAQELEKARDAESARLRAIAEQQRYERFMAQPQPYGLTRDANAVFDQIVKYGNIPGKASQNARPLLAAMASHASSDSEYSVSAIGGVPMDVRSPDIEQLCGTLLSRSNLLTAARACDADHNLRQGNGAAQDIRITSAQLSMLYRTSAPIRETVDRLLESPSGILLLAALTRSEKRTRQYANHLRTSLDALARIDEFEAELEREGITSEEEKAVFREDKNYAGWNAQRNTLNQKRHELAGEIRMVIQGRNPRKFAGAEDVGTSVEEEEKAEAPPGWQLGNEFQVKKSPLGAKHILVFSAEYPDIAADFKLSASPATVQAGVAAMRMEREQHRVNLSLLERLVSECGFQLTYLDNRPTLRHKEYALAIPLPDAEVERTTALQQADELFAEKRLQQDSMLDSARQNGMTVEQGQAGTRLTHPALGVMTLAPRGYFSDDDFDAVEGLLARAQNPESYDNALALDQETRPLLQKEPVSWQPTRDQTLLVFDAPTLNKLTAKRNLDDRSWLDMIACTAQLPNVTVVIPSVVADWEMQGKIPVYDKQRHFVGFEQMDSRFQREDHRLYPIASEMEKFLAPCSRARITAAGAIEFYAGSNTNIIVMETPGDRALYERIKEIRKSGGNVVTKFSHEIHGQGHGEQAIDRILEEIPSDLPAIVVSDDFRYFRNSAPTTRRDMPVGHVGTGTYLAAELKARAPHLRPMLDAREPLSLYGIGKAIKHYWAEHDPSESPFLGNYNEDGQSRHRNVQSIEQVIAGGHALRAEQTSGPSQGGGTHRGVNPRSLTDFAIRPKGERSPAD